MAATVVRAVNSAVWFAVTTAVLLTAASLVLRFRGSTGTERQQLKWFAYAGLATVAGLMVAMLGVVLPPTWGGPIGDAGWISFIIAGMLGMPVAMGIAVLRHRLYDIDVVINRTLVYGTLTAALAATYVGSVLLLQPGAGPAGRRLRPLRRRLDAGGGRTLPAPALADPGCG